MYSEHYIDGTVFQTRRGRKKYVNKRNERYCNFVFSSEFELSSSLEIFMFYILHNNVLDLSRLINIHV